MATQHTAEHEERIHSFAVGDPEIDRNHLVAQLSRCPECLAAAYELTARLPPVEPNETLKRLDELLSDVMNELGSLDSRDNGQAATPAEAQVIVLASRRKWTQNRTLWAMAAAIVVLVGGVAVYRMMVGPAPIGSQGHRIAPLVSVVSNEVLGDPEQHTVDGATVSVTTRETIRVSAGVIAPLVSPSVVTVWVESTAGTGIAWWTAVETSAVDAVDEGQTVTLHLKDAGQTERTGIIVTVSRDNATVSVPAALLADFGQSFTLWWAVSQKPLTDAERIELSRVSQTTFSPESHAGVQWLIGPTRVQLR
ncbi:MAG: hypothetical protein HUU55_08075 [Myxococcales bacterium]|nr:hypothetical protein [Myxococcales bacterium]